ncbi:Hypothetical predicted protein [Cloeon dipterum]|uniref:Uncharacterized protein n=1 Tax=Cloeon dipterum TaxID=197152 RepID=A0A8S1DP19_9INSE|nr:Hypothetical predicted protein [Cloeon dipterum]
MHCRQPLANSGICGNPFCLRRNDENEVADREMRQVWPLFPHWRTSSIWHPEKPNSGIQYLDPYLDNPLRQGSNPLNKMEFQETQPLQMDGVDAGPPKSNEAVLSMSFLEKGTKRWYFCPQCVLHFSCPRRHVQAHHANLTKCLDPNCLTFLGQFQIQGHVDEMHPDFVENFSLMSIR